MTPTKEIVLVLVMSILGIAVLVLDAVVDGWRYLTGQDPL